VLLLPTELASVEAKIEKKAPARLFYSISFTHDPVNGGVVGVSAHPPVQPVCALAFVVFTGGAFVVLAPPDLGTISSPHRAVGIEKIALNC